MSQNKAQFSLERANENFQNGTMPMRSDIKFIALLENVSIVPYYFLKSSSKQYNEIWNSSSLLLLHWKMENENQAKAA